MSPNNSVNILWYVVVAFVCVVFSGIASGLSQGLLFLNPVDLKVRTQTGISIDERKTAAEILTVINKHHLLVVTLLLLHATAMELLPIALNHIIPQYTTLFISIILIITAGEIVPAILVAGPYKLQIVVTLLPFIKLVMLVYYPIAYPISLVLEWCLPPRHEFQFVNKIEIATILKVQNEVVRTMNLYHEAYERQLQDEKDINEPLFKWKMDSSCLWEMLVHCCCLCFSQENEQDEEDYVPPCSEANRSDDTQSHQTDSYTHRSRNFCMNSNVFNLWTTDFCDEQSLNRARRSGQSYIPVIDVHSKDVTGIIPITTLLSLDTQQSVTIDSIRHQYGVTVNAIYESFTLNEILAVFRESGVYFALVYCQTPNHTLLGAVTPTEIVQTLLQDNVEISPVDHMSIYRREMLLHRIPHPAISNNTHSDLDVDIEAMGTNMDTHSPRKYTKLTTVADSQE